MSDAESTRLMDNEPHPAPIPNSYWLPGHRIAAGEYPGALRELEARAKIGALLDAGVRVFVDLTTPDDLMTPYVELLADEAGRRGVAARHVPLPIRDMDVPTPATMTRILDALDEHAADGRVAYVHCWGGVGRTGLVVGCHLVRHGASGEDALETVRRLFATMSPGKVRRHRGGSPQTTAQCAMVRTWAHHDRGREERT